MCYLSKIMFCEDGVGKQLTGKLVKFHQHYKYHGILADVDVHTCFQCNIMVQIGWRAGVCRWNCVCTRGLSFPQTKLASAVRGAFDAVRRSLLSPQRLHLSCRFPNNCLLSALTFVRTIVFCGCYRTTHRLADREHAVQVKPDRDISRAEPMCAPYLGQLDIRPIITTPKLFLFTIKHLQ